MDLGEFVGQLREREFFVIFVHRPGRPMVPIRDRLRYHDGHELLVGIVAVEQRPAPPIGRERVVRACGRTHALHLISVAVWLRRARLLWLLGGAHDFSFPSMYLAQPDGSPSTQSRISAAPACRDRPNSVIDGFFYSRWQYASAARI